MDFIWVLCGAIPPLRHYLKIWFVGKRRDMEFSVMRIEESAQRNKSNTKKGCTTLKFFNSDQRMLREQFILRKEEPSHFRT